MQKGFAQFIIIGVVVLVIIAAGAFYLGKQAATPEPQPSNRAATSQIIPSPAQDETVNWKIYTNKIVGYEIKYPPFLKVTERDFGAGHRITIISDMELADPAVFPFGDNILVAATGGLSGPGTPEIYNGFLLDIRWPESSYISPEGLSERKKLDINGWNAYRQDNSFKSNGYEGSYSHVVVENSFRDQLDLYANYNGSKKEYVNLFDAMLTTFKFLDNGQTKIEFPPYFDKVEWEQETQQKNYSFRNPAIVGDVITKTGVITLSKIYKDFPQEVAGNFQDNYQQWLEERGWRVISGSGGDLKRYMEGELEYYKNGRHFRFGLTKISAGFRFFFVHD